MLNNALAVGVAGAVVVVTATILGAVELLWKAVAVGVAATEDEIPHDKDPENSRRKNDPLQPIQHRELLTTRFDHSFRCRWCSVRFEDRASQKQRSRMRLGESQQSPF